MSLLATFHPKSAATDHRQAVFRVQRTEKTH
jgi:hypothetical protein